MIAAASSSDPAVRSLCGTPQFTATRGLPAVPPTFYVLGVSQASSAIDPEPPRHSRRRRRRVLPWIALAVAIVVLGTAGYAAASYLRFDHGVRRVDAIPAPSASASSLPDIDGAAQNILLVGDDVRPPGASQQELAQLGTQEDGGSDDTDTMIILHIAAGGRSAELISLPRDSYVSIPGHGTGKLNSAFALGSAGGGGDAGGAKLLINTVQSLTGLTIDHFVRVSLLGFYDIVKILGPVTVCLNHAVQDSYSGIDLPAGVSTLNAQQALAFVRQRHGLPDGDLDREARQQYFLSLEAKQVLSADTLLNPVKVQQLIGAISSSLETDQGFSFLSFAEEVRDLRAGSIRSATIPILGTPTITVNGAPLSIVQVNEAAMPAFIASVTGPPPAYAAAVAAAAGSFPMVVLNGSGMAGAATAAAATLRTAGYDVVRDGDAAASSNTLIEYPTGHDAAAKAVAARFPGAIPVPSSAVSVVTVLLGTSGAAVATPTPTQMPSAARTVPTKPAAASPQPMATPSPAGNIYGTTGACVN